MESFATRRDREPAKGPNAESQFLRIRTLTVNLHSTQGTPVDGRTNTQLYCTGLGRFLLKSEWDGPPEDDGTDKQILCAVFSDEPEMVLLLRAVDNSDSRSMPPNAQSLTVYERVGVLKTTLDIALPDEDSSQVGKALWDPQSVAFDLHGHTTSTATVVASKSTISTGKLKLSS
jgi:hypothetical protein